MHFPDWKELPRCWFLSTPPLTCYTIHRPVLAVFRDDSISILVTQSDLLTKGALLLSRACHAAAKKVIGFALQSCLCSLLSWWLHCKYFLWDGKTVYSWSSEIQIFWFSVQLFALQYKVACAACSPDDYTANILCEMEKLSTVLVDIERRRSIYF